MKRSWNGLGDAEDPAEDIVEAPVTVRDALVAPSRRRVVDGPKPEAFSEVAEYVLADSLVANAPAGLAPTAEEMGASLRVAN